MRMRSSHVAPCPHSRKCTCACLPAATGGQIGDEPIFVANRFDVSQLRAPTPWTPPPEHPPHPVPKGPQPPPKVLAVPRSGESLQALVPLSPGVAAMTQEVHLPMWQNMIRTVALPSPGVGSRTQEVHVPMWQHMLRPVALPIVWAWVRGRTKHTFQCGSTCFARSRTFECGSTSFGRSRTAAATVTKSMGISGPDRPAVAGPERRREPRGEPSGS